MVSISHVGIEMIHLLPEYPFLVLVRQRVAIQMSLSYACCNVSSFDIAVILKAIHMSNLDLMQATKNKLDRIQQLYHPIIYI